MAFKPAPSALQTQPGADSEYFFTEFKKGEVNELQKLLSEADSQRDTEKLREAIKKVIAYMTHGVDLSRLFSQMVMASNTTDIGQKKLVYLYLCNYATSNPELSLLAINTLLKDCKNAINPMIRGLALRSLCSLRVPGFVEYIYPAISSMLDDPSPYVRKTAVISCGRLYQMSSKHGVGLVDKLYSMLRDKDSAVVANAVYVLDEILKGEGGIALNRTLIIYLLNRLREFNQWQQTHIMSLLLRYTPSEQDTFDILNILEERLKHTNSAVVYSAATVFIHLTESYPKIQEQVFDRLRPPLLTILNASGHELAFSSLKHLSLLVFRVPQLFQNDYKLFFCKWSEPVYVKLVKIEILRDVVTQTNFSDIVSELSEYVLDTEVQIVKRAVKAIGRISGRIASASKLCLEKLISFLELDLEHVGAITMSVFKDILRQYPEHASVVLPQLKRFLSSVGMEDAKGSIVWILGEYGEYIDESPYLLEAMLPTFGEQSTEVKLQLFTSIMKLFGKRPAECQTILGQFLEKGSNDHGNIDVKDKALLYYRLLQWDVRKAMAIVNCPKDKIVSFPEDDEILTKDRLLQELNSLSVIYGKTKEHFMRQKKENEEEEEDEEGGETNQHSPREQNNSASEQQQSTVVQPQHPEPVQVHHHPQLTPDLSQYQYQNLSLNPNPSIDPQTFTQYWTAFVEAPKLEMDFNNIDVTVLQKQLQARGIRWLAGGTINMVAKLYLYAQESNSGEFFLVELLAFLNNKKVQCTVKARQPSLLQYFAPLLQQYLSQILSSF